MGDDRWGKYLRMRVLLDLEKPLKRGTILKGRDGSTYRIFFKYERLLDFGFNYGRIRHLLKDCIEKDRDEECDSSNVSFGPWMRVSPVRARPYIDKEEDRNMSSRKMIFKPPDVYGGASLNDHATSEKATGNNRKEESLEEDKEMMGREVECVVVIDSGFS